MSKLWEKANTKINPLIEDYTVGNDHITDLSFMKYDVQASIAHTKGLVKLGILTEQELEQIETTFVKLLKELDAGEIEIPKELEDGHTFIEQYLVDEIGDIGKKIHTGRSRNDQALTMIRLWQLEKIDEISDKAKSLIKVLLDKAKKYEEQPFPGYSHTQQAMLTSLGHYFAAYAESLIDDLENLNYIKKLLNKSPLGSAAGYGSNLDLPRQYTSDLMNFNQPIVNSLYAQNTRAKLDSVYAEGLSQIMLSLNKVANDFLIFTTREFNFFDVPGDITTGSSIMPQKRNYDLLEILKGKASLVISEQLSLKNIFKDGLSGYNREVQFNKEILIKISKIVEDSLSVIELFMNSIQPNFEEIESKIQKDIFSADIATQMAEEEGIPFREAYKKAMEIAENGEYDLQKELAKKKSLGSGGNLGIQLLEERLGSL